MQLIDQASIEDIGLPGAILMERAALAVVSRVISTFTQKRALILCGTGNNGGDGIAIARELHNRGYHVTAAIAGKKDKLSPDALAQYQRAKKMGVPITFGVNKLASRDTHGAIIIDALFGTGLARDITGAIAKLIRTANESGAPIASVDIPSGISADTGQVLGIAIHATITVTFGLPKRGHFLYPGAANTGELFVHNIGFPAHLLNKPDCARVEAHDIRALLPIRPADAHKGDFGHALIVAGSSGKTGAAFMSSRACVATGAGLTTLAGPDSLSDIYQMNALEEMTLSLRGNAKGTVSADSAKTILEFLSSKASVLAIGPGLGNNEDTKELMSTLLQKSKVPMVIDADALNALEGQTALLKKSRAPIILTPHPGEFARLTGMSKDEIQKDRISAAINFAKDTQTTIVLKGAPTIIASVKGYSYINSTGGAAMAKGGTGDVLTGMIAAFLAQGLAPIDAAVAAVYLHGLAGDLAAIERSQFSATASDIIWEIGNAFKTVLGESA
jgi:hydroxyethylthiazole kinase-like uncharacterized protein yjeF